VKLVLVAQDEFGPQLSSCRDRFLVQSLPIMPGQKPDGAAFRAQKFKVQDHKFRVSIVSPQQDTRCPSLTFGVFRSELASFD
jgi:hypothetical protein